MKTKPISIRFDENDLLLAKNLSGVCKPQKLVDLLISEYVKHLKGSPIELPKDFMNVKNFGILKNDGTVEELKFHKPEKRGSKNFEPYNGEKATRLLMDEVGTWAAPTYDNEAIQKQIDEIKKEKIPEARNTVYGRKVWQKEQDAKIDELKKLLK